MHTKRLLSKRPLAWIILLAFLLLFPLIVAGDTYYIHLITITLIYYVLAQSLNLLLGYTGFASFGQIGFFSIGAYCSSLLMLKSGYVFWLSTLVAVVLAGSIGFLVGLIALRFRSHVFALVTLALAELMRLTAYNWKSLTGGPDGIFNIPRPNTFNLFGIKVVFTDLTTFYFLIVVFAAVVTGVSIWITKSSLGKQMVAVRENETYARFVGINTWLARVGIFTISAAMAGLSGVLYAHYVGYISPYTFGIDQSVNALLMVILGGGGTILGPLVGSAFVQIVPEILRDVSDYRMVIYGAILVLAILFMPKGIVGLKKPKKIPKKIPGILKAITAGKAQVVGNATDLKR